MTAAIDIRDLLVRAGRRDILRVDAMTIAPREVVTLLGPNGAGKSTLLHCLVGFTRPWRGRVHVLGRDVRTLSMRERWRLRRRVALVPQLLPDRSEMPLTVREVVSIGRTGRAGVPGRLDREDRRIVDEWLARLGLGSLAGAGFGDCSGGEQRKALIAKAMVQQPEILLLDEPTANLDLYWREQIVTTMQEVYEQTHTTLLLVCHELEVVPPCCGRIALLTDGHLVADGPCEHVLSQDRLAALYGPGVSLVRRSGRQAVVPAALAGGAP